MTRMRRLCLPLLLLLFAGPSVSAPPTRTRGDVMRQFEQGLTESGCADASRRWRMHYAQAAKDLADEDDVALMVFAYVLDEVREAGLPSELALIPFVETHFQAEVRSTSGPAGLWQFTASTARHHGIRVHAGRDGRMSVISSTRAAVKYLGHLHRMFGQRWRQTAMAYNVGEGALKTSRRKGARRLPGITRSYPVKMHAIACLLIKQARDESWQHAVQRPLPRLVPRILPAETHDLRRWARRQGLDVNQVVALNPGWRDGSRNILAPVPGHAAAGRRGRRKAN